MKRPEQYLVFANREEWRSWLAEHGATEREAWVIHYKKGAAQRSVTYEQGVEEALCFGWIDGLLHRVDEETYALRYSPRKSRSVWSVVNQARVEKLIETGRMTEAGLAKVAEAKENGEWDAAIAREDVSLLPPDLADALQRNGALAAFEGWPASRKKQYLHWVDSARRPETRQKRIKAIVELTTS